MKIAGIYKITNIKNHKFYIGSTKDFKRRVYVHLYLLRKGEHANSHLQYAWDKYGEDTFVFDFIEEIEGVVERQEREMELILELGCTDREKGYNISFNSRAPMEGRKHTKESIEKMRNAKLGEKNHFFGRTHNEETRKILREQRVGKRLAPEHREKVLLTSLKSGEQNINAKLNWEKVHMMREEYNMAEKKHGMFTKLAKKYNVDISTIARIIKNKTWITEEI